MATEPPVTPAESGATEPQPEAPPVPLLTLREPLPDVVETPEALAAACAALGAGTGPVAIDAERASGYRYSSRAYLIQLRRTGSGTWLIDPIPFGSHLPQLAEALHGVEWILHAATQDLPCLREVGLQPTAIFDTELGGRLLGYPRVGLATLVEELLGQRLRKEHSAADWSQRPLPAGWLDYAALDVEVLIELRELMVAELEAAGKTQWAVEEFTHLLSFEPTERAEPWRRVSGLHRLRGRRAQGIARALWEARDRLARDSDISPGKLIPDSAIVAAAAAAPTSRRALLATDGFHGRAAGRQAHVWVDAIVAALALPDEDLPNRPPRVEGPPQARMWAEVDPTAARRLTLAKERVGHLGEELKVPVENLLTPDTLRRTLWAPPATREPDELQGALDAQLTSYGARAWQRELMVPLLAQAVLDADQPLAEAPAEAEADGS